MEIREFVAKYVIALMAANDALALQGVGHKVISYEQAIMTAYARWDEKEAYEAKEGRVYF